MMPTLLMTADLKFLEFDAVAGGIQSTWRLTMKKQFVTITLAVLAFVALTATFVPEEGLARSAAPVEAKMVFDMRDPIPEIAALHLQLIRETHGQLQAAGREPDFKVVFIAHPVKFLSSDRSAFSAEDQQFLEQIDQTITGMVEAGIEIEVCRKALDFFQVDPATVRRDVTEVPNGWLSLLNYQEEDFKLIPVY